MNCPVCGEAGLPEGLSCPVCGLPAELFEPFQAVAGDSSGTGPTVSAELARQADGDSAPTSQAQQSPGAPVPTSDPPAEGNLPERRRDAAPPEPNISAGSAGESTDELLQVGRSLGLNPAILGRDLQSARAGITSPEVTKLRRDLTRVVVDGLLERYRQVCLRRNALSTRSSTQGIDTELIAFRKAIQEGRIGSADEHRQRAEEGVQALEAAWSRVRAQIAETSQMVQGLRDLGGVAPSVLHQITDSFRLPHRPEPGPIEHNIRRANSLLWNLLVPRISHELSRSRALLRQAVLPPANAELIRTEIDRLTEQLRARKVGEALETSKWLNIELMAATRRSPQPRVRTSILE